MSVMTKERSKMEDDNVLDEYTSDMAETSHQTDERAGSSLLDDETSRLASR